jgi:N-acetylmuramoyl-L-alanine amidase
LFDKVKNTAAKYAKKKTTVTKTVKNKARDIIVAVDAGHGGEDPGAHGPKGTQEKKVVLAIAKKLAALIDRQPGMKAVMVRKGDYYIKLRKRMQIARAAKADLFVSIHADAVKNSKAKGASVFTLSRRGASSEAARWLAKHENAADLVGGVSLDELEDTLASVLLDLSQTATKKASRDVGSMVLQNFKTIGYLHKNTVQKAGFMVLKSPDIPSILVETAFISNPREERKLRSSKHQQQMAQAIFKGVLSYFKEYAPADTLMVALSSGQSKHVISRGETLSGIAQQYGVSMKAIKIANALAGNTIRIGQVLKIPADS